MGDPEVDDLGPSAAKIALAGLRSLCTTLAAWITVSASASLVARAVQHPGTERHSRRKTVNSGWIWVVDTLVRTESSLPTATRLGCCGL
jgi:hypothetical protein